MAPAAKSAPVKELLERQKKQDQADALVKRLADAKPGELDGIENSLAQIGPTAMLPLKLAEISENFELRQRASRIAGRLRWRLACPEPLLKSQPALVDVMSGSDNAARAALVERGWWDVLAPMAAAGRPVVGICLGLQLLAEGSEESPGAAGLGLVPGVARLLGPGVKVPNMGWGKVRTVHPHPALPLCADDWLYFVHSYALDTDAETVLESTHGRPFSAVQARGRVLGFQGHPEKSGAFGEALLRGVLAWLGEVPCA